MAEWVSGLPKGFTDTEPLPPEIVESMCEIRKALPSNRPMAGDIFAGSYSFGLGSELVWDTAFYIEFEDYPAACLKQRMSEGVIPKAPLLWGHLRRPCCRFAKGQGIEIWVPMCGCVSCRYLGIGKNNF